MPSTAPRRASSPPSGLQCRRRDYETLAAAIYTLMTSTSLSRDATLSTQLPAQVALALDFEVLSHFRRVVRER
jgi:hypothetical protein